LPRPEVQQDADLHVLSCRLGCWPACPGAAAALSVSRHRRR
jgi:hypothetical protein